MGYLGNRYLITAAPEREFGVFNENAAEFSELCPLEEGFSWSFGGPQMLDKPLMRADVANTPAHAGSRHPEVKMTLQARGGGAVAGHGASAQLCRDLDAPLSACLGTARAATGAGILSASGPASVTVSGVASMRVGEIVWVDPSGAGSVYPCAISAMESNTLNLWPELPTTPSAGGVVYAACNFTPFSGPVPASLCLEKSGAVWSGKRLVERMCGLAGSLALSRISAREQLQLKLALDGVADESEEAPAPRVVVSASGAAAWKQTPAPVNASSARLYMGSAVPRRHSGFEYDPGAEIKRRDDIVAIGGWASHFVSGWAEKGVLHLPWDAELKGRYAAAETFPLLWACGDAANGVALYIPAAQIMEIERETVQGEEFMKLSFRAVRCDGAPSRCLAFSGRRNS